MHGIEYLIRRKLASANIEDDLDRLKPVRIQFISQEDDKNGFATLMISGMPVHALQNNTYIINRIQVQILDEKHIPYTKLD
jgi:hypothetical protein